MDFQFILNVPTSKCSTNITRDERLKIQTLFNHAGQIINQICLQLSKTPRQVRYVLSYQLTPQKKRSGARPYLNTPRRKFLIDWVCASKINRRIPWAEILSILGWDCGEKAIRSAFKKEGFIRWNARTKPPLSKKNRIL